MVSENKEDISNIIIPKIKRHSGHFDTGHCEQPEVLQSSYEDKSSPSNTYTLPTNFQNMSEDPEPSTTFPNHDVLSFYDELSSMSKQNNSETSLPSFGTFDQLLPTMEDSFDLNNVLLPVQEHSENSDMAQYSEDIQGIDDTEDRDILDLDQNILNFTVEEEKEFNIYFESFG